MEGGFLAKAISMIPTVMGIVPTIFEAAMENEYLLAFGISTLIGLGVGVFGKLKAVM